MSEIMVRKHYPSEFKAEAIKLVEEQGYSCRQAGKQLGIPHKTLANWVRPRRKQQRSAQIAAGVAQDDPAALRRGSASWKNSFAAPRWNAKF